MININAKFDLTHLLTKLIEIQAATNVIFNTQAQIISKLEDRKFEEVLENMNTSASDNFNIIKIDFIKNNQELFDEKFRNEHPEIFET